MKTNSGYGRKNKMHPTNTKQKVGCLGPHERILEVGYENHMVFQEGGDVPLYMTPQERVPKHFGNYDELQLKDKTKSEFLGNIKHAGVDISVGDLQDISCKN